MSKKVYRSLSDRKIAGVCGGLGEYFDIDPTLVRDVMLASLFAGGAGLVAYIVAWILIPASPQPNIPDSRTP